MFLMFLSYFIRTIHDLFFYVCFFSLDTIFPVILFDTYILCLFLINK